MAVKTTYVCDHCGKEQTTPEQMWGIGIVLTPFHTGSITWPNSTTELWCRACISTETGLLAEAGMPPREKFALNKMLRRILRKD